MRKGEWKQQMKFRCSLFSLPSFNVLFQTLMIKKQAETLGIHLKIHPKICNLSCKTVANFLFKEDGLFFCVCKWCMQILVLKSEMEKYILVCCSLCQNSPLQLCARLLLDKSSSYLLSKDLCCISYTHFPKPLDCPLLWQFFNHCLPLKLEAAFILQKV